MAGGKRRKELCFIQIFESSFESITVVFANYHFDEPINRNLKNVK